MSAARRWAPTVLAACFLFYFGVQFYCDFRRPEPMGAVLLFEGGSQTAVRPQSDPPSGAIVESIAPDSPAARAGLRPSDRIRFAGGRPIATRLDWMAIDANLQPGRPLPLVIRRVDAGGSRDVSTDLILQWGHWADWRSEGGGLLLAIRATQAVSLLLAFVLAAKRPSQAAARRGVWLLATLGIFSIVLPSRFAAVWREIPPPFAQLLWIPFLSNAGVGAVFLTFFASFPRPLVRSRAAWAALWTPIAIGVAWYAWFGVLLIQERAISAAAGDFTLALLAANLAYLVAGVAALAWNYRRLDVNERRRVRVLMLGVTSGTVAAAPLAMGYWFGPRADFAHSSYLSSPVFALGTILILLLPLSLTYAVLRHRLFDVSVIIRIGVRYALARGVLAALMPAIAVAMIADALVHADRPLASIVAARAPMYLALAAAAWIAYRRQRHWLDAIDRRFFREKYDAHHLLRQLAADIRQARSLDRAAPKAVAQIEAALHPEFAAVIVRRAGARQFETLSASPAGRAPAALPASFAVVGLLRVLRKPIELELGESGWIQQQLPAVEAECLRAQGIDLVVPIAMADREVGAPGGEDGPSEVVLALGAKRSEEPYSQEDLLLLTTIADALALLVELGAGEASSDAAQLLAGRYRIDRELGRGGMGTVYAATDTALARAVAVKVMRIEIAGAPGAAARFQREARAAASFAHPNVVTVHDFGMMSGGAQAFLVMELLQGRTLRDALRSDGPIAPRRTLAILEGVCAGVDAAHQLRLVHRDLKPENIFLCVRDDRETAKILDFGIAKALPLNASADQPEFLTGGGLIGTVEYMAPEQLRGEAPSPAWDLWALSVIACEMLAGAHPFAGAPVADAPRLASYRAFVADRLDAIPGGVALFIRALALDPSQRPRSASALFAELSAALG